MSGRILMIPCSARAVARPEKKIADLERRAESLRSEAEDLREEAQSCEDDAERLDEMIEELKGSDGAVPDAAQWLARYAGQRLTWPSIEALERIEDESGLGTLRELALAAGAVLPAELMPAVQRRCFKTFARDPLWPLSERRAA
ncbi:MAG: hypothetical protein ABMA13_18250 [Chthoniobacteraceae bacterium]